MSEEQVEWMHDEPWKERCVMERQGSFAVTHDGTHDVYQAVSLDVTMDEN